MSAVAGRRRRVAKDQVALIVVQSVHAKTYRLSSPGIVERQTQTWPVTVR